MRALDDSGSRFRDCQDSLRCLLLGVGGGFAVGFAEHCSIQDPLSYYPSSSGEGSRMWGSGVWVLGFMGEDAEVLVKGLGLRGWIVSCLTNLNSVSSR